MPAKDFSNYSRREVRQLAEGGDVDAMVALFDRYMFDPQVVAEPDQAIAWLRKAADAGHPEALFRLGLFVQDGFGEPEHPFYMAPDPAGGLALLEKAVEQRYPPAMTALGVKLFVGDRTAVDKARAEQLLHAASDADDPVGMYQYGSMLAMGDDPLARQRGLALVEKAADLGVGAADADLGAGYLAGNQLLEPNFEKAIIHLQRAVEKGHARSAYMLGKLLVTGQGVQEDPEQGYALIRAARAAGVPEAAFELGMVVWNAEPSELDGMAVQFFQEAAQAGFVRAFFYLGVAHDVGRGVAKDQDEARRLFTVAAENGHVDAMYVLALVYREGDGVPRDQAKSVHWLRQAAQAGQPQAMNDLGVVLQNGDGCEQNEEAAFVWFRSAAEQGSVEALHNLAGCYRLGRGVEPDATLGATLARRAAEAGSVRSMGLYAHALARGEGVPQDLDEARRWLEKARDAGDPDAAEELKKLG